MSEKVILPRDVAKAIEAIIGRGGEDKDIIAYAMDRYTVKDASVIFHYAQENFHDIMSALVNGYTVEQTPEEKVREYYDEQERLADEAAYDGDYNAGQAYAIEHTLNLLGITIEGINA